MWAKLAALFLLASFNIQASTLQNSGDDFIRSQIDFSNPKHPKLEYADISKPDPFEGTCPLDRLPEGMKTAADQLIGKVRESVTRIRDTQNANCNILKSDLGAAQNQLQSALANQLIAANPGVQNPSQDLINATTQKASAANQLFLTVSTLSQSECINSTEDKVAIQRLIGQIVTFSGLIYGNWPGLAAAMGGQFIGNVPIFRNPLEKAALLFQIYDEMSERGEYLCAFRQMQKTECLMFADPKISIIHGVDTLFESGITRTTKESVDKIKEEAPALLHDVELLWRVYTQTKYFNDLARIYVSAQFESSRENPVEIPVNTPIQTPMNTPIDILEEMKRECGRMELDSFQVPDAHPVAIRTSLTSFQEICKKFEPLDYWNLIRTSNPRLLIQEAFWHLKSLREYYESLRDNPFTELGKVAGTWESLKYFETFAQSMRSARDQSQGSQDRINYRDLIKNLRRKLTRETLKKLMKNSHKKLVSHGFLGLTRPASLPIQREAIKTMISLCQTLDPTLACLYANHPDREKLNQSWIKKCVGPKSVLCRDLVNREHDLEELKGLLNDPKRWTYLESLCHFPSG